MIFHSFSKKNLCRYHTKYIHLLYMDVHMLWILGSYTMYVFYKCLLTPAIVSLAQSKLSVKFIPSCEHFFLCKSLLWVNTRHKQLSRKYYSKKNRWKNSLQLRQILYRILYVLGFMLFIYYCKNIILLERHFAKKLIPYSREH